MPKSRWRTDPSTLPTCDSTIHASGKVVAVFEGGPFATEGLIEEANRYLSYADLMDWHYAGGRVVVKTLGDVDVGRRALCRALPTGKTFRESDCPHGTDWDSCAQCAAGFHTN